MIKKCTCQHEYQDKEHGKGMRVHNQLKPVNKMDTLKFRCTVCKSERT
jgi:hypothetical protein